MEEEFLQIYRELLCCVSLACRSLGNIIELEQGLAPPTEQIHRVQKEYFLIKKYTLRRLRSVKGDLEEYVNELEKAVADVPESVSK
jgi:hypothetical protein